MLGSELDLGLCLVLGLGGKAWINLRLGLEKNFGKIEYLRIC